MPAGETHSASDHQSHPVQTAAVLGAGAADIEPGGLNAAMAQQIGHVIDKYKEEMLPCIVQIPGAFGNTGKGVENVKKFVETAVGSDILFSQK